MQDLRILFDIAADTGYLAQLADAKGRRLVGEQQILVIVLGWRPRRHVRRQPALGHPKSL
jgi:hypothetical protein